MSLYSIGAGVLGGTALAGWLAWQVATAHYSNELLGMQHELDTAKGNNIALTEGINNRNVQIQREHLAYIAARDLADKLQAAANHNANAANVKAKTILVYKPGDDYALSSLDVVAESLK